MSETWGAALLRAVRISVWLFALAVVSIASVLLWSEWRTNVAEFEANLDPRPRPDWEEFPGVHDDAAARVAAAKDGLAWVNRRFAVNGGICGAIGAGLIAGAVVYRRRSPRAPRSSWRSWILMLPLLAVLVALALVWLGVAARGTMRG